MGYQNGANTYNVRYDTYDTTCNDDYLEIRDGYSAVSPLMGKFCGTNISRTIVSTQNNLWLR